MPPRIRSPTPDESSYSDSDPVVKPAATTSSSKGHPPLPPLPSLPTTTAKQAAATSSDDDLSSLSSQNSPPRATSSPMKKTNTYADDDSDSGSSSPDAEMEDQLSEEDEESEEEEDEEDDNADDVYYDDASEDEEMDELDDDPAPVAVAAPPPAKSSGVKIKFKLGASGAASKVSVSSPAPAATGSKAAPKLAARTAAKWTPSTARGSGSKKGTGKGKKKASEDVSDLSPSPSVSDEDDFSDGYGSVASSTAGSGTRLTARQRAKEMGGPNGMELQSLPNQIIKATKASAPKLSEAELALRKSEMSRKRKHQSDKKLEDEKTETINRLLKKQIGKTSSKAKQAAKALNPNNASLGGSGADDDSAVDFGKVVAPRVEVPQFIRWVSSTKSGEYVASWNVPGELVKDLGLEEVRNGPVGGYPGPRPALLSRSLV